MIWNHSTIYPQASKKIYFPLHENTGNKSFSPGNKSGKGEASVKSARKFMRYVPTPLSSCLLPHQWLYSTLSIAHPTNSTLRPTASTQWGAVSNLCSLSAHLIVHLDPGVKWAIKTSILLCVHRTNAMDLQERQSLLDKNLWHAKLRSRKFISLKLLKSTCNFWGCKENTNSKTKQACSRF